MDEIRVHASTVSFSGRAVLIRGASGKGKSSMALQLMALGCGLIADDQTILQVRDGQVWASCPDVLSGRIEARGLGILAASADNPAPIALIVDLDRTEQSRLPQRHTVNYLGIDITVVFAVSGIHFVASILQYLKEGRAM